MNQETPRTPQTQPEAHVSGNPSLPSNGEPQVLAARPSEGPSPAAHGSPQGLSSSRPRSSSRLPQAQPWSRQRKLWTAGGLGLFGVFAVFVIVLWWTGSLFGRQPFNGPTWTVHKERLKIAIVERGSLESAKNADVICTVKARAQGSTIASSIRWLVEPGTEVKGPEWKKENLQQAGVASLSLGAAPLGISPLSVGSLAALAKVKSDGEKIMELDSSGLQDQLQSQSISVDQYKAAWIQAEEDYHIQEIDNETDIESKKNALDLARIDLEKYINGDYVQAIKDVEGRIEIARSDLENWKDRASWSERMVKKSLVSKVQAEADQSRVDGARINLQKVEEEKRVLEKYTKSRTIQDLTAKVAEARRGLEKAKSQAKAKLAQKEAARLSARSVYEQNLSKKREIEAEIAKCTIMAPQEGMVVYYVPEQVRGGSGTQQSIVAQGEPVREGQKMLQIPDLSQMMVNVRVHEALVRHLRNDADPNDKSTWQHAKIRVDAFPSRVLHGHVMRVDTMASQQDWFASDVKLYKTLVTIDESMEGLRPGMSAEVTIYAEESEGDVLVVPIQSVVGTISSGANRKVFVLGPDGQPELRDVVVGLSNEQLVEVQPWNEEKRTGLKEGEKVVLNPAPLLAQGSDLRPGKVRSKNEESQDGGEGGKKNGKKGGKKGLNGGGPNGIKGGPGGPNGGPGVAPGKGPVAGGKGFGGPPSPEKMQAFETMLRAKTPAERREFLNSMPEDRRGFVRQFMRSKNLEVSE